MELQCVDAIAGRVKRRKSAREALLNAYDTLVSIDAVTGPNRLKLPGRQGIVGW